MNSGGNIKGILIIGVIILGLMFFGFIIIVGSALFSNAFGVVTHTLVNLPQTNEVERNITSAMSVTFGNLNGATRQLNWLSFALIFGVLIAIIICAVQIRSSPYYAGLYIIIVIILELLSIFISRTYESLYNSIDALKSFSTGSSFIFLNLPIIVGALSLVGGFIIFVSFETSEGGI